MDPDLPHRTASGTWADNHHSNVLRLHIHRALWDDTIILKKLKPKWDDEFDNEKLMYARLRPLQGSVIPVFFGEASLDGCRALILSDVGRVTLCDLLALLRDQALDPGQFERATVYTADNLFRQWRDAVESDRR
ncbi:hypothetical protein C8A05DRAFT_31116 [Staphylotrichum tortipilum]|uniref:Uncharacterized protein n=1 Tax=Staphylotrichum tortipilum TaxID=2831512 RepID=A0AAN6MR76_9PEZI|nr:hypothetical protein C8A05DRAFT_31116 [Staphylotrichum longicolle]